MVSQTVLVACEALGGRLSADAAAAAIGRGLHAARPELAVDRCLLGEPSPHLDERMRAARAVVIAARRLDHATLLRGGPAFELATRARQAGVPAYALAVRNALDAFEARILDLQVVLSTNGNADAEPAFARAGSGLARLI